MIGTKTITVETRCCDHCHKEDASTYTYVHDGVEYSVDLCPDCYAHSLRFPRTPVDLLNAEKVEYLLNVLLHSAICKSHRKFCCEYCKNNRCRCTDMAYKRKCWENTMYMEGMDRLGGNRFTAADWERIVNKS